MSSLLHHRVSYMSLCVLFIATICSTVLIQYLIVHAPFVVTFATLGHAPFYNSAYISDGVRIVAVLYVAVMPFRRDIELSPPLIWPVLLMSLAAMMFTWFISGHLTPEMCMRICVVHLVALGVWRFFLHCYEVDVYVTPDETNDRRAR